MSNQDNKPTLKEANLQFVLKKTIADFVTDEVKEDRAERMEELLRFFHEIGTDRFTVELPGGEAVATISISKPKPKLSVNENVLMGWLETNGYENLIQTVTIPERTEKKLPVDILDQIGAIKTEDGEFVTPDGVPVDGAQEVTPEPSSFTVRYTKGGQYRLLDAYRAGELSEISAGTTLPQIEGGQA